MNKIILTIALFIFVAPFASAQTTDDVAFLGVDFSAVNVMYAAETSEQFTSAFERINVLMVAESEKYDVAKFLNVNIEDAALEHSIKNISTLEDRNFIDFEYEEISCESVIDSYPATEGAALLLIARELNKAEAVGKYDIVIFDGTTKEIIKKDSFVGEAGGFGLRNYWAGSIYNGLKKYWKISKRRR